MWAAPFLVKHYRKEMKAMMQEGYDMQMEQIMDAIAEANANNLDIYLEMNPEMATNMVAFYTGKTEEEEVKKDNPFSIVDEDEE